MVIFLQNCDGLGEFPIPIDLNHRNVPLCRFIDKFFKKNEVFIINAQRKRVGPKAVFRADPFALSVDDKYFIFFEEFVYEAAKGHISVIEIDRNGKFTEPITVLEKDYHL